MAASDHSTAIVVAVIGVLGTIGTAVITNWDKIFPAKQATPAVVRPAPRPAAPPAVAAAPKPPLPTEDTLRIISTRPPLGTRLGGNVTFDITVAYQLNTANKAVLIFGSALYQWKSGECTRLVSYTGHEVRERIARGSHQLSFRLPSGTEKLSQSGAIGFYASFMDADAWDRGTKSVIAEFPELREYCFDVPRS